MAHKIEGKWHSLFATRNGNETVIQENGRIEILTVDLKNGKITGTYTDLDGKTAEIKGVVVSPFSDVVTIEHVIPDTNPVKSRHYEGALVVDTVTSTAQTMRIVVGTFRSFLGAPPVPLGRSKKKSADAAQEQGTWVATQP
jgi:hypothetical protein